MNRRDFLKKAGILIAGVVGFKIAPGISIKKQGSQDSKPKEFKADLSEEALEQAIIDIASYQGSPISIRSTNLILPIR